MQTNWKLWSPTWHCTVCTVLYMKLMSKTGKECSSELIRWKWSSSGLISHKLKGTVSRFRLWFFHQATSFPVRHAWKGFRIFSNFQEVNRIRNRLPSVFTTGESRLTGVFTTGESWLHCVFIPRESRLLGDECTGEPKLVFKKKL